MENRDIEIGCDGGSILISRKCINGTFFYRLTSFEIFTASNSQNITFIDLNDTWIYLKQRYPKWYQLYLIQISTQMIELVKKDYILATDKNEYTMDRWMEQLTGRGIGF